MIHRHRRADSFVLRDTHADRNKSLSLQAKGLHGFLMQLHPDFKISIEGLVQFSSDGRTAVASAMNELIRLGYVVREKRKAPAARFAGYDYHVFERPEYASEFTVSRFSVYGKTVNGLPVNGKPDTNKELEGLSINETKEGGACALDLPTPDPLETEPPLVPPAPPAEARVSTLEEAVEDAMRWTQENASTLKWWYETARLSGWTTERLKSEVAGFFSHYRRDCSDLHRVYREPLAFFTNGFFQWLNNPIRKQQPGQQSRPKARVASAPVSSDYSSEKMVF